MEKGQNYLIIDDDSTNNLICEFRIKKFDRNAAVQLFQEPEKALWAIENGLCGNGEKDETIIFLDINMPTMTGFEFLDEFQKLPREVQNQFTIYMLTSSIEDFTEHANRYSIVCGFLSKPLSNCHLNEIKVKKLESTLEISSSKKNT